MDRLSILRYPIRQTDLITYLSIEEKKTGRSLALGQEGINLLPYKTRKPINDNDPLKKKQIPSKLEQEEIEEEKEGGPRYRTATTASVIMYKWIIGRNKKKRKIPAE